jgi:hypothetical protein
VAEAAATPTQSTLVSRGANHELDDLSDLGTDDSSDSGDGDESDSDDEAASGDD